MRLQLEPEWAIECDATSCQLIRVVTITGEHTRGRQAKAENIGKTRDDGYGFYGRLDHALQAYLLKSTAALPAVFNAQQVIAHMNQCMANITAAVSHLPVRGV